MSWLGPGDTLRLRARLRHAIREFFGARSYLEIDTPCAVPCPGAEVHLSYFRTEWQDHAGRVQPLWLRSSPELHMKQALATGLERIFQIGPCWRNHGELAQWHHPEFTMLEWYRTGATYEDFIAETEALLRETHARLTVDLRRDGITPAPLPKAIQRLTVAEAFREFAGLTLEDEDPGLAGKAVAAGSHSVLATDDFATAFFKVLIDKVEPGLERLGAAVLCDYPPSQAALAVVEDGVARRFEFYVGRIELSNGFKELTDPGDNRARLTEVSARRRVLGLDVPPEDEDFLISLGTVPECCGNALGFDRWLAILMGATGIGTVVPFRRNFPWRGRVPGE